MLKRTRGLDIWYKKDETNKWEKKILIKRELAPANKTECICVIAICDTKSSRPVGIVIGDYEIIWQSGHGSDLSCINADIIKS